MKQFFALIITSVVFFSCSKEDKTDPQRDAFASFQGKYLVCESVVTTVNGISTTQVIGKGKGWDISFGLYGNLDIYTSPVTSKNYQFTSPDKIYYWTDAYNSNQYYTRQSMSGNKIVLKTTDNSSGKTLTENFVAE